MNLRRRLWRQCRVPVGEPPTDATCKGRCYDEPTTPLGKRQGSGRRAVVRWRWRQLRPAQWPHHPTAPCPSSSWCRPARRSRFAWASQATAAFNDVAEPPCQMGGDRDKARGRGLHADGAIHRNWLKSQKILCVMPIRCLLRSLRSRPNSPMDTVPIAPDGRCRGQGRRSASFGFLVAAIRARFQSRPDCEFQASWTKCSETGRFVNPASNRA